MVDGLRYELSLHTEYIDILLFHSYPEWQSAIISYACRIVSLSCHVSHEHSGEATTRTDNKYRDALELSCHRRMFCGNGRRERKHATE